MTNTIYQELRSFVKEHHGFGAKDFEEHPEIELKYNKFMNYLRELDGKRVKIKFTYSDDFISGNGEKTGRIKVEKDKKLVKFYEGKHRKKFNWLDAGLFDGFFATLIPIEITTIK